MVTKKEKKTVVVFSIISILCGLIAIVPFTTLFNKLGIKVDNIQAFELVVKLIDLPVLVGLFCIAMCRSLNNQSKNETKLSVSRIRMSFAPAVIYLTGLLEWIVGVVYASNNIKENEKAKLAVIIFVVVAVVLNLVFTLFTKWMQKMTTKEFKTINVLFYILSIFVVAAIYIAYDKSPAIKVLSTSIALLEMVAFLIFSMIIFLLILKDYYKNSKCDIILSKNNTLTSDQETLKAEEDSLAELHKNFVTYYMANKGKFIENKEDEEIEAKEEIVEAKGPENASDEETLEAKDEVLDKNNETLEKQEVKEVKSYETKYEESEDDKLFAMLKYSKEQLESKGYDLEVEPKVVEKIVEVEKVVEKEVPVIKEEIVKDYKKEAKVKKEVTEKPKAEPKQKKEIKPSVEEIVEFIKKSFDDVEIVYGKDENNFKVMRNKKLVLNLQSTATNYKLTFQRKPISASKLIVKYPNLIVQATTPKGEQWFKATNKGDISEEDIKSMIKYSHKYLIDEEEKEALKKQKEKEKLQAKKEAEKAKEKAKKEALKAKEKAKEKAKKDALKAKEKAKAKDKADSIAKAKEELKAAAQKVIDSIEADDVAMATQEALENTDIADKMSEVAKNEK